MQNAPPQLEDPIENQNAHENVRLVRIKLMMNSNSVPSRMPVMRVAAILTSVVHLFGGCQQVPTVWRNPLAKTPPAYKAAYGPTPRERMQSIHELAQSALGMSPDEKLRTVQQLSEMLDHEPDPLIRRESITTLAQFDLPEVDASLQRALRDPSPEVRAVACRVSGGRPTSDVFVNLIHDRMINDEHHEVRCAAVAALIAMRTPESLSAAAEALRDQDPAIQVIAMNALQKSTGQQLGRDVNTWLAYIENHSRQQPVTPGKPREPEIQLATAIGE